MQILLDAWGCALPEDDDMLFRRMGFLPFQGRVSLSAPDHQFRLMRASTETNRGMPHMPLRWYFCRQVCSSLHQTFPPPRARPLRAGGGAPARPARTKTIKACIFWYATMLVSLTCN